MCIRDRFNLELIVSDGGSSDKTIDIAKKLADKVVEHKEKSCLLYTSDAADERSSVDLGGRRIIKKKKKRNH